MVSKRGPVGNSFALHDRTAFPIMMKAALFIVIFRLRLRARGIPRERYSASGKSGN
jgi:hypothetical protein